ncbi:hypothetical protein [Streptomyces sp. NPDC057702]|uniref:hypothetical protein n=1 Tax=unclassified Streptomyces TaxID=2593676 RepID=UPI0036D067EC
MNATPVTVPSQVPGEDGAGPSTFGEKLRPKLSGWAQKVIYDRRRWRLAMANPTGRHGGVLAAAMTFEHNEEKITFGHPLDSLGRTPAQPRAG